MKRKKLLRKVNYRSCIVFGFYFPINVLFFDIIRWGLLNFKITQTTLCSLIFARLIFSAALVDSNQYILFDQLVDYSIVWLLPIPRFFLLNAHKADSNSNYLSFSLSQLPIPLFTKPKTCSSICCKPHGPFCNNFTAFNLQPMLGESLRPHYL